MLARVGGAERVIAGGDQFLFALDPRDGRQIWKYEHGGRGFFGRIINPVVMAPDQLLLTHRPDEAVLLDTSGAPRVAWSSRELKLNYATPVVHGGFAFGYSGAFLSAVNVTTGALAWRSRPPGDGFPIIVDGRAPAGLRFRPLGRGGRAGARHRRPGPAFPGGPDDVADYPRGIGMRTSSTPERSRASCFAPTDSRRDATCRFVGSGPRTSPMCRWSCRPDGRIAYQLVKNLGDAMADPRNPRQGGSLTYAEPASLLLMPRASSALPEAPASLRGSLIELEIESAAETRAHLTWGGKRKVRVYLPPGYHADPTRRYPALYVLYGEQMLADGRLQAVLDREMGATMRNAIAVFVDSTSGFEYARTFRDAHMRMLTGQLVPLFHGHQPRVERRIGGVVLDGAVDPRAAAALADTMNLAT